MRVLLVDDDRRLVHLLGLGLRPEGCDVTPAYDATSAIRAAESRVFDVVVLDVMLPDGDGVDVLRELRATGIGTPVLLLTALSQVEDRVRGLDGGADDYLVKPFAFEELMARMRALHRRACPDAERPLRFGPVVLDRTRGRVTVGEEPVMLSRTEFQLLECFLRHPGQLLTRAQLLAQVWDDQDPASNVVDQYVHYLRRRLGPALTIETVRGTGYRLAS